MRSFVLSALVTAGVAACDDGRRIREWRPSDHEAPQSERTGQVAGGDESMSVQVLYARLCVTCHGPDGRGGSMPGIRAPDITRSERPDAELVRTILRGRGRMPGFAGQITEEDARDLVALIKGVR
jgi:mono/diheme cytochrome c family protein